MSVGVLIHRKSLPPGVWSRRQYMAQLKVTNFVDGSHNCVSANSNFAMCCMSECTRFLDFNTFQSTVTFISWTDLNMSCVSLQIVFDTFGSKHWAKRRDCGNSKEVLDIVGPYLLLGMIALYVMLLLLVTPSHAWWVLTQVCYGSTRKRWRPCRGKHESRVHDQPMVVILWICISKGHQVMEIPYVHTFPILLKSPRYISFQVINLMCLTDITYIYISYKYNYI